jgi:hypothetical protein
MTLRLQALNVAKLAHKVFSTDCTLIAPDGVKYETDVDGNQLVCQLLSGRVTGSPDSGEEMAVFRPVATFFRSSLQRVPADGENWSLEAPLDPDIPTVKTLMAFDNSKAIEGGRSLGTIRIYLSQVNQS